MPDYSKRHEANAQSKANAEHDGEEWTAEQVEWLQTWDGSMAYLLELAELLGRTIEACRERFYSGRRTSWVVTTTTTTSTTYRGWVETDGDGGS